MSGKNEGRVVYRDRFGNLFTNFLWDDSLLAGKSVMRIGNKVIKKFYLSYSQSQTRSVVCIRGSSGLIEVAVDRGNASEVLNAKIGTKAILISE